MELQPVAGGGRVHPADCDAQKDSPDRKYHLALRRGAGTLQVFLHPQLGIQVLRRRLLLLDADPQWPGPDGALWRLPLLLLPEHQGRKASHRAANVTTCEYVNIKQLLYNLDIYVPITIW